MDCIQSEALWRLTNALLSCFLTLFLFFFFRYLCLSVCLSVCPFSSYVSLFTFFFLFYHSWLLFLYFLCVDCCMSSCSLSPGKAARISRALHWDKKESVQNTFFSAQYSDLIRTNTHTHRCVIQPYFSFWKMIGTGWTKHFWKNVIRHSSTVFSLSQKKNN